MISQRQVNDATADASIRADGGGVVPPPVPVSTNFVFQLLDAKKHVLACHPDESIVDIKARLEVCAHACVRVCDISCVLWSNCCLALYALSSQSAYRRHSVVMCMISIGPRS